MSKEAKNESISDSLNLIVKKIETLQKDETLKDNKSLNEILETTIEIKTFFKGVKKIFHILFSLVVLLMILLIISTSYNIKLENVNSELENLKIDSTIQKILDIKRINQNDSITTSYSYQVRDDKIVTYNDLVNINDSLLSLMGESVKLRHEVVNNNDSILNLLKSSYESNLNLYKSNINLKSKNYELEKKLNLINENYGIDFSKSYKIKNDDTTTVFSLKGKKVDSAFILLNHYRKNLSYDKVNNEWHIIENK
ncbi:hypothetical protein CJ739_2172 [Mariniflexile rhizosphaerae]|uniref:hypothetical protein n=1 Tax=unclassified Mariniflexile TaxID=2643887 RepID=UPI000CAD9BDD|nr:hypothetical protein [Mariniflexile sp. TRM1-10]AXP81253.1 hypothetical protein CJ739_2172 [Mariniflexile sp. TRM1-10]PLB18133.1 MAG: hypothetical protein TRG1_3052 [Flavobacteriaceae bacterium FS1-H7996/R]